MKAAIYTRFSTEFQQSTEMQIQKCREYAAQNNIEVVAVYSDEAETGTNAERGQFEKMLYAAQNKEFDAILIYNVKRGSRDVADWFNFRKLMSALGIKVISCTEKLGDILNPNDFLTELINVGIGQHEILSTRLASIDGKTTKAKTGVFLGGYPPLGYDVVDSKYVINEVEAKYVRFIFQAYAEGKSYNYIVDKLKEMGARGKRGQPLGKNSLYFILRNERYTGTYSWNKHVMRVMKKWVGRRPNPNMVILENAIPAIIDKKTFEKVRERMNDNKKNARNKAKYHYTLSGLIECGHCGASYVGVPKTKKGKTYRYYVCGERYRTRKCSNSNISADYLEAEIFLRIKAWLKLMNLEELAKQIVEEYNKAITIDYKKLKEELTALKRKIERATKILLEEDFPSIREELRNAYTRKAQIEELINDERNVPLDEKEVLKQLKEDFEHIDELDVESLIRRYISKIIITGDEIFITGLYKTGSSGRKQVVFTIAKTAYTP